MNEAWTWRPLGEVTLPGSTWNPRTDPRPSIRYVDVSAVSRNELRIVSDAEYSLADAPSRARKVVKAGDTIFATIRPALRRIAQIPGSLDGEIVSTAFCVLRPNLTAVNPAFLYFAMQLDTVTGGIAAMQGGASYPAVRDIDVLNQAIPLPPLSVQNNIADALNLVQSTVLGQKQCEDAATCLKRAAMQTLFTRGLRGEAQKETEIGPVPESWDVSTLGEMAQLERGRFMHRPRNEPRFYGGATPFVQTGDVVRSGGRIREFVQTLNEDGVAISRVFPAGTILITIAANIGFTGILQLESACPDSLVAITPHESINCEFLEYFLQMQREEMDRLAPKGTQKNINIQFLKPWKIVVPPYSEQREIVAILNAIDRRIDLHGRKCTVLEELFKALLHKLMTGEVRVEELDLSAVSNERNDETVRGKTISQLT